jgi:ring-1,2-phenylacetyl-CoA epoxidase subunit PaaD
MIEQETTQREHQEVWDLLDTVMDPEIPMVSLVELGVIDSVLKEGEAFTVTLIPTFSGCPALDVMRDDIIATLDGGGFDSSVKIARKPWSTDRMSDSARAKMKKIGIAPPTLHGGNVEWEMHTKIPCPYCDSMDTQIENHFGPTLCRAIYYCNTCQQPFERFKQL